MDARFARAALLAAAVMSLGAGYRTANFVVTAPTGQIAEQVARSAEKYRRDLAVDWLGAPMKNWSQPCPITVEVGGHLGAGGATSFVFDGGEVFGWQMTIQGPLNRILDSVLPHEVTHTVFATYFRQPLPRWADEGACSTVEHTGERMKQQKMLVRYLQTGRGIPFSRMFAMKEYPRDMLPLYAQGHSLATFLIAQGGKHKFLSFVSEGLENEAWPEVTTVHYGYKDLGALQSDWLDWVKRGSPLPIEPLPLAAQPRATDVAQQERRPRPEPNLIYRSAASEPAADDLVPVRRRDEANGPPTGALAVAGMHASDAAASRGVFPYPAQGDAFLPGSTRRPIAKQVARPPAVEKARQIILEWDRPAAKATPQRPRLPSHEPHREPPRRSVYEARVNSPGVALR